MSPMKISRMPSPKNYEQSNDRTANENTHPHTPLTLCTVEDHSIMTTRRKTIKINCEE